MTRNDKRTCGLWPPETREATASSHPGQRRMLRKRDNQALRTINRLKRKWRARGLVVTK